MRVSVEILRQRVARVKKMPVALRVLNVESVVDEVLSVFEQMAARIEVLESVQNEIMAALAAEDAEK